MVLCLTHLPFGKSKVILHRVEFSKYCETKLVKEHEKLETQEQKNDHPKMTENSTWFQSIIPSRV